MFLGEKSHSKLANTLFSLYFCYNIRKLDRSDPTPNIGFPLIRCQQWDHGQVEVNLLPPIFQSLQIGLNWVHGNLL